MTRLATAKTTTTRETSRGLFQVFVSLLAAGSTHSSMPANLQHANTTRELPLAGDLAAGGGGGGGNWFSSSINCNQFDEIGDLVEDQRLRVEMSTFWYCFLALVTTVGLLVSLVSNMIIIYLFFGDLLYCIQWPSVIYCSLSQSTWMLEIDFVCKTFGFITVTTASASVLTVLAMSVERAIVIKYSIQAKSRYTIRSAWLIVVLIWCVSIASSLPPLFDKFNRFTLDPSNTSCTLDYLSGKTNFKLYMLLIYIVYWILPATIITICYLFIMITFKRSSRRLAAVGVTPPNSTWSSDAAPPPPPPPPPPQSGTSQKTAGAESQAAGGSLRLAHQRSIWWSNVAKANLRRASTTRLARGWTNRDLGRVSPASGLTSKSSDNLAMPDSGGAELKHDPVTSGDRINSPLGHHSSVPINRGRNEPGASKPGRHRQNELQACRSIRHPVDAVELSPPLPEARDASSSMVPRAASYIPEAANESEPKIDPTRRSNEHQQQPGTSPERRPFGVLRGRSVFGALLKGHLSNGAHSAIASTRSLRAHHNQLGLDELAVARLHASLPRRNSNGNGVIDDGNNDISSSNNKDHQDATTSAELVAPVTSTTVACARDPIKSHSVKLAIISKVMAQLSRGDLADNGVKSESPIATTPTSTTTTTTTTTTCHFGNQSSHTAARASMQIRLAKMSFYLILLWLVSWTPIASLTLINLVVKCHLQASALLVFLANTMTKLGPTFDVFIYGISHPKIKRRFVQIIGQLLMLPSRRVCAPEPSGRSASARFHTATTQLVTRGKHPIEKSLTLNEDTMFSRTNRCLG